MKKTITNFLLLLFALNSYCISFTHTSTNSNSLANWTKIDNPYTNGKPNLNLIVNHVYNPKGSGGVYHNHEIGVFYTGGKWAIYNVDIATMASGVSFNILAEENTNSFRHLTTASNTSGHISVIDNPVSNNTESGKFLVTQSYFSSSAYNKHATGLWYTGGKWTIFNQDKEAMPANTYFNVLKVDGKRAFTHTAVESNIISNYTLIDHPALNNNPNALVFATPVYKGVYTNSALGVWYNNNKGRWSIYNENTIQDFPKNSVYNIYFEDNIETAFVHTSTPSNSTGNYTVIDNAQTNGKPDLNLIISHIYNPSGKLAKYHNHELGVFYTSGKWAIYNVDVSAMPEGVSFNVLVPNQSNSSFKHITNASNITSQLSTIDNPVTNSSESGRLIITQSWAGSAYNNHAPGIWYNAGKWTIYNQDVEAMTPNTHYNVLKIDGDKAFTHTATASNTTGNYTLIDHSALNNRPNAKVFVTPVFKGVYTNSTIGVWYSSAEKKWSIYNEDPSINLPKNSVYNVYYINSEAVTNTFASEENELENITIFPVPATDYFYINQTFSKNSFGVKIFNSLNQEVYQEKQVSEENHLINCENLPQGFYTIQIIREGNIYNKSIIITK